MAHKVETMAYNERETPWHGLGTPVRADVSTEEMIEAAGLGWGVGLSPVRFYIPQEGQGNPPRQKTADGKNVLFRTDTGEALDIVGPRWEPVQNVEVFEFFREYVEAGDATLETAGSLDGGRMVWALAKLNRSFSLDGDDKVESYVLLANPHQYRKSLTIKTTDIRVVCNNTITRALKGGGGVKLWHNRKFDAQVREEAKRRLGIARDRFDAFAEVADRLQRLTLDDDDAARIAAEIMGESEPTAERADLSRTTNRILDLYGGAGRGSDLPSARNTGWGLLNAVTEYHDHEYGHNVNNRIRAAWFGPGETRKRKALRTLLPMAPK